MSSQKKNIIHQESLSGYISSVPAFQSATQEQDKRFKVEWYATVYARAVAAKAAAAARAATKDAAKEKETPR